MLVWKQQVENQEIILEYWKKFLNSLTWPEMLRQVLVAAGFGSNQGSLQREVVDEVAVSYDCHLIKLEVCCLLCFIFYIVKHKFQKKHVMLKVRGKANI